MFYGARNGSLAIGNTDMHYVCFGRRGAKNLVIIPGLDDGFRTVKGMAKPLALRYRLYATDYLVHVFSRKNDVEEGYSTRDMARDLKAAMDMLGIGQAHVMGISQGGMIAQYLAIDYPEVVDRLVIGISMAQQSATVQQVIGHWITLAESNDYAALFIDAIEKTYPETKARKLRPLYPVLTRIGKPCNLTNFIVQARACLGHNAYEELHRIKNPTLVIGDDSDRVVGEKSSEELAARIPHSELYLTKGLGHGAFGDQEFNQQVLRFLKA